MNTNAMLVIIPAQNVQYWYHLSLYWSPISFDILPKIPIEIQKPLFQGSHGTRGYAIGKLQHLEITSADMGRMCKHHLIQNQESNVALLVAR